VTVEDLSGWAAGLDDLMARIAGRFRRVEPRRRARAYLLGLLSPLAGKNGWTLAEAAGEDTPDGMQRLRATRSGTPTPSATIYVTTSQNISATPTGS